MTQPKVVLLRTIHALDRPATLTHILATLTHILATLTHILATLTHILATLTHILATLTNPRTNPSGNSWWRQLFAYYCFDLNFQTHIVDSIFPLMCD